MSVPISKIPIYLAMDEENKINKTSTHKTSIVLGIIYGLVAAGFYVTPWMFFLLGLASLSSIAAMQIVLIRELGWLFLSMGALLTLTTILIYLQRQHIQKLTLGEVKPYRAFIGTITLTLVITYAVLTTIALFTR